MAFVPAANAQDPPPAQPDEPIVPDSQFEEELPKLDPDMDKPLEPLDTFDVEGEPAAAPDGTIAPAAAPDDPALSDPLPPISSFDVETPQRRQRRRRGRGMAGSLLVASRGSTRRT